MKSYLFIPLAMNQTLFYEKIAEKLVQKGHQVFFICFHERSHFYLTAKNYKSFNPYRHFEYPTWSENRLKEFEGLCQKYKFPMYYHLLTHEQVSYGLKDQHEPILKYIWTIRNLEKIFEENFTSIPLIVVQELGGFASVISGYYISRFFGFDHYFLEPSFFRGRYFLLKNSFIPEGIGQLSAETNSEVAQILERVKQSGEIVIPFKDRTHYLNLFNKVFSRRNFVRFYQKLYDKYVLGYYEEFRYIYKYSRRHILSFYNKWSLSSCFTQEVPQEKFIYYPLHVPLDVAITFRSPVFKDQINLIDLICRSCPLGYKVAIKEHPAMVGVIKSSAIKELLNRYQHLILLNPKINNYKVMKKASLLVTVNSKSGAEALSIGKRVIVLGDAFYTKSPLVTELRDLSKLSQEIARNLILEPLNTSEVERYFSEVWKFTNGGDLYQLDDPTIQKFANHIDHL